MIQANRKYKGNFHENEKMFQNFQLELEMFPFKFVTSKFLRIKLDALVIRTHKIILRKQFNYQRIKFAEKKNASQKLKEKQIILKSLIFQHMLH